jgi:predicted permease
MQDIWHDVAYALRGLRRRPGFACVAVAILAIALGANTAMFTVVHHLLIAELPVRDPGRLVVLKRSTLEQRDQTGFDYAFFRELADGRDVFEDVLCRAVGSERVTVGTENGGAPAAGELVCGSYFEVLGVRPHLGRLIGRGDDISRGAHPVVVLSHGYWRRQFGGDPGVIDRTVRITGVPMTVIGVLPEEFTGLDPVQSADLRAPLSMIGEVRGGPRRGGPAGGGPVGGGPIGGRPVGGGPVGDGTAGGGTAGGGQRAPAAAPATIDGRSQVIVVGRLRDGVSAAQAAQIITARWQRYVETREPAAADGRTATGRPTAALERVEVESAASGIGVARRQYQTSMRVLMVATLSVLAIACLNLINLLLVRAAARRNEFATRLALGAGPARLVRQLFVESLILSLAGAALGAALAYPFAELLIQLASPGETTSIAMPKPTATVLMFHAATALVCALLFGSLPSLTLRRFNASFVRERESSPASAITRRVFLAAQVAVAVAVLVGAALFVRTERALRATDLGFDADRLLVLAMSPQNAGAAPDKTLPFFRAARERVQAVPGVSGATYGWIRPLINASWTTTVNVTGSSCCPNGVPSANASRNAVGPAYFTTLGIPLVAGRDFVEADHVNAPKVAIVNETFARMYGNSAGTGSGNATALLGARIGVTTPDYTIVGIVKDSRYSHLREAPTPVWYVPYEQQPNVKYLDMYIRTAGPPSEMTTSVRAAIASIDPGVALFEVRPLQAQVDRLLVVERMLSALTVFFGAAGAILAGLGLYGMVTWLVASRSREIGVRLALGATPAAVAMQVTAEAWKSLAVGVVLGAIIAGAAARYVATLLFGVTPLDPVSFAAGVLVLVVLVTLAAAIPMRRASRADPMIVLRDA